MPEGLTPEPSNEFESDSVVGINNLDAEATEHKLTEEDLSDLEDFQYLLSIMEKQGASGITQPSDYEDAIAYRDKLSLFRESIAPEGPVTSLFNDVIFDFDGVLYDSTYSVYRTVQLVLDERADKHVPQPASIPDIANTYQAPFHTYYKRFGIPLETPEDIASFRDTWREVQKKINSEHHTPAALYPEVKNVLDRIKEAKKDNPSLKIHIISAASEQYIKDVLSEHGILDDFDEVHADCHNKTAMIRSIADNASDKEKTVMVGDLPSDIKDAQVEKMRTIGVARGVNERTRLGMYLPDYIINDLNGILDLKSYSKELREAGRSEENAAPTQGDSDEQQ